MTSPAAVEQVAPGPALLLSLASTVLLAALHLLAPRIRRLPLVPEKVTASFAGGIAVAYVFLHLLPELARGNERLREVFDETLHPSAMLELAIFVVALIGFCLFYGLQRWARTSRRREADGDREPGRGRVFGVHLAAFALYNAVITYTMPLTYRTGVAFAVLFTIAMGLHFVLSDRSLEESYGARFDRWPPRLLLAAALGSGWLLAAVLAPTSSVTVSLLTAFLAGSVLLNVFQQELPGVRDSSYRWFLIGIVLYAVLLGGVTVLGADTTEG